MIQSYDPRVAAERASAANIDFKERGAVLDDLAVFGDRFDDLAGNFRLNVVEDLHRLDNEQSLPLFDFASYGDKRVRSRTRCQVDRSDHLGFNYSRMIRQIFFSVF